MLYILTIFEERKNVNYEVGFLIFQQREGFHINKVVRKNIDRKNKWGNEINGNELSRKELKLEKWCLKMEKKNG